MPSVPRLEAAPQNGEGNHLDLKAVQRLPFSSGRGFHRDALQPRGKTAHELTIGRKLRELREERHLTQQDMAGRAGVPRTYISRIENARLLPGPPMLHRIADALGVALLDLLPQNMNGQGHPPNLENLFWNDFLEHFSQLRPEQMSRVVAHVRTLVAPVSQPRPGLLAGLAAN